MGNSNNDQEPRTVPEKKKDFDWTDAMRTLREFFDPASEANRRFRERMQPFAEVAAHFQTKLIELNERMRPVALALYELEKKYRPHIIAFVEALHRFEEFNTALVASHEKDSLAIPPFFKDFTTTDILELFHDREKSALDVYRDYFSKHENVDVLLKSWSKTKFFEDRIPILRDALSAHVQSKHTLSIPAFLAQSEGILCDLFDARDHAEVKGKLRNIQLDEEDKNRTPFANAEIVARIITKQVFQSSRKANVESKFPNRHHVLHGISLDYYKDPYASLRCILLLDLLRSKKFMALSGKLGDEDQTEY